MLALAGTFGCDHERGGDFIGANSALVGGACRANDDCQERCVTGAEFPQGMCTITCASDYNCPVYTYCVDKKDGVCLPACYYDYDCRLQYRCRKSKRQGIEGDAYVCIE
jgi:hypothetical protein